MSSKLLENTEKTEKRKFFHSERPAREVSTLLTKSDGKKGRHRQRKKVDSKATGSEAPLEGVYEFVFDPSSEPELKKKSKTVRRKRVARMDDPPYVNKSNKAERAAEKRNSRRAIVKIPNPSEEMTEKVTAASKTRQRSDPSEKEKPSVVVDSVSISISSKEKRSLLQEVPGNLEFNETQYLSRNQDRTVQTRASHGILKTPKPILKLQNIQVDNQNQNSAQNYAESPGFDFVKHFEKNLAGSGGKKRVNFSTPLGNKNQVLSMNASFVNLSPMPMCSPRVSSSNSSLSRNSSGTIHPTNSYAIRSPWRLDTFFAQRKNTVNSSTESMQQASIVHRAKESQTGTLRDISNLPVLTSQKRKRLSLREPSKQAKTHSQEVRQSDPFSFGFEDSDEISTPDRSPENVPDKNVLHFHRSLVREFSKTLEKHKSRPTSKRVNKENAIPELPLFYDPTEPESNVKEDLTEEKDIPYRLRKPRMISRLSLPDSDEESVAPSPKKKGRVEGCEAELESFAKEFNSMCEEVQKYELVVEPKRT